ncbi:hypothetical protein MO867_17355 [Microbulbifer sp. OS29]|uniref:Membrane-bound lysozyme-inhibitor of c-type lysozyme n=1 Tax=Microbulbifer okhotskensis TaxID=2926617 RepID=A0A9X2EQP8_9GAMM|nr:hypothetical protein [Microbulbifer okhotskensis]MCO1336101.1 hypothetical protein [Microbulbifer okhotskensis]
MRSLSFFSMLLGIGLIQACTMSAVPSKYQGHWAGDQESCSVSSSADSMTLASDRVLFTESSGQLMSSSQSDGNLHLIFNMQGEGETWRSEEVYSLNSGGQVLVRYTKNSTFKYFRCN